MEALNYPNHLFAVLLFTFVINTVFCQDQQPKTNEELISLISHPETDDTLKVKALLSLSSQLYQSNPDTVILLCKQASKIAERGLRKTSAHPSGEEMRNTFLTHLTEAYNFTGIVHHIQGNSLQALRWFKKCAKIEQQISNSKDKSFAATGKKAMAGTLNNIGAIYYNLGDIDTALAYYHKSLNIKEELEDKKGIATTYSNIGNIYDSQGNIPKALEYYHSALKIQEETDDKKGISVTLNNLGYNFNQQGDTAKALEHYRRSLAIRKELGDKVGVAKCLNNVGVVFDDKGNFNQALNYFQQSLHIQRELKDSIGMGRSLNNIGNAYFKAGKYQQAQTHLQESLLIHEKINDKKGIANTLYYLGLLYHKTGDYATALSHGKRNYSLSEQINYPDYIRNAAKLLSMVYQSTNKNKEALKFYQLYITMRDSINNENIKNEAVRQQLTYEYKKRKAIDDAEHHSRLQQEKALAAEAKKRQQIIIGSIGTGLGLVILFSMFLFNRFRVTRKQKILIEHQKEIVDEKNKEILDSINYAKRLQDAILPPDKLVNSYLKENFILFKPKDIVAGDFYFLDIVEQQAKSSGQSSVSHHQLPITHEKDAVSTKSVLMEISPTAPSNCKIPPPGCRLVYIVAADCTGHGVPGAMVSILGANGLKRCIQEFGLRDPGEILDKLSQLVAENFSQSEEKIRDGMDLAMCCLEMKNDKAISVHYAGANNPLWIINPNRKFWPPQASRFKGDLPGAEIKPTKQAIGYTESARSFESHKIDLEEGDVLYIFSDGFVDQFGGDRGRKFKSANLKKLLLSIQDKNMDEQKHIINACFEKWKGNLEQVDDVCIIGVRI